MASKAYSEPLGSAQRASVLAPGSVAAVVVTFNRKALLAECLDALLSQTRPLDRIFVIDQVSTDGTPEMLEERGYLRFPVITYSRSKENTGGAGGFQRGLELAHKAGFDLIWIMDDDAIAEPTALEKMLRYSAHPGLSAIANAKVRVDGTLDEGHFVYAGKRNRRASDPPILTFSSFVGLLILRTAIDQIGTPKAELFLQGDDTEYCRRLCQVGRIVFARDSVIIHKEVSRPMEKTRRFGRSFTVYPVAQFCFQYFMWRNRVWIETHGQGFRPGRILWLISKLMRVGVRTCLVDQVDLRIRLFILLKAVRDGLAGRFDNEFPFRLREQLLTAQGSPPK